jgi:hypothetical protein
MSDRVRPKQRRKPPPRWRRFLTQAELDLPAPTATMPLSLRAPPQADDAERELEPIEWWRTRPAVFGLAALALALLVVTVVALRTASRDRALAAAAEAEARTLTLRAVSGEQSLRIEPNHRSWSAGADAVLAWPEPPQLLQLYIPVGYTPFQSFALIIDKVDHGRVIVLERLTADSNRELRLGLNSSTLGPGEYRLRVQGYTWRGERIDVGWIRLQVNTPR